jgi:hypothetical protein
MGREPAKSPGPVVGDVRGLGDLVTLAGIDHHFYLGTSRRESPEQFVCLRDRYAAVVCAVQYERGCHLAVASVNG